MNEKPSVLQSERAILGLVLSNIKKNMETLRTIEEDMFTVKLYQNIVKIVKETSKRNPDIDLQLVLSLLETKGLLPDGPKVILDIVRNQCSITAAPGHIESLIDCMVLRKVVMISSDIGEKALNRKMKGQTLVSLANQQLFEVSHLNRSGANLRLPGQGADYRLTSIMERNTQEIIRTGQPNLDAILYEGWLRKHISVVASRPGMGKSTERKIWARLACKAGFGVLDVSTEQAEELESDKMNSLQTGIPYIQIFNSRDWGPNDPRWIQIIKAEEELSNWKYASIASRSLESTDLWDILHRVSAQFRPDVAFVDLFDRFTDVNVEQNKPQRVSNRLGVMAQIAEYFNMHLCIFVQISRAVEKRVNRRPTLSDLKDSGAYEEFARQVLFLYRESYYNPEVIRDIMEANVGKQNNGPAGASVIAKFSCRMESLELIPIDPDQAHGAQN